MSGYRLEEILRADGLLAKVLAPGYEPRPQQVEMARAVHRTLGTGGCLVVEAPTGVGKSLAYLIPGILWAQAERRPLVVSTFTRALQDQILDKDLPHLRRLIEKRIRVAVLKGRSNYLCRNRWHHLLEEMRGTVEGEDLERALGNWVEMTETGDLSEAPIPATVAGRRLATLLPRIASESRFCSTPLCAPETGCFFKRSRVQAREADLLIVNHALLLVDLLSDAAGLPDWRAVVIDEAHHLPRAAADPLSLSVSERGLEAAIRGLGGRGEPGCTDQVRRALRNLSDREERQRHLGALRELETETARLESRARLFWEELRGSAGFPAGEQRLRYGTSGEQREDLFPSSGLELCDALSAQERALAERLEEIRRLVEDEGRSAGDDAESKRRALLEGERFLDDTRGVTQALAELLVPTRRETIYWIEPATAAGTALRSAPLEVGPTLREALFRPKETVILTSATLALDQHFDHYARKVGLEPDGYEGLLLATPFCMEEQVAAFVLTGGPDPNDAGFAAALAAGIERLARRLRRKMLVLFTAHETLRQVETRLRAPLEERGIRLLAQGVDGAQRQVRAGFEEEGPAVLLGAASFWEGVDFPGAELEILVMARLPFAVPNDPLVEAMGERLQREGRDPFREFQLPEAMIRFRQGFGRLIRRATDRGLFVAVDPRLETRSYGRRFVRAVGVPFRPAADWDDLVNQAAAWFGERTPPDNSPEAPPGS